MMVGATSGRTCICSAAIRAASPPPPAKPLLIPVARRYMAFWDLLFLAALYRGMWLWRPSDHVKRFAYISVKTVDTAADDDDADSENGTFAIEDDAQVRVVVSKEN